MAGNGALPQLVCSVDIDRLTQLTWKAMRAVDCGPIYLCNGTVCLDATSSAIPASLSDVAKAFLGRYIPKMYRLSNWSRRPLLSGQIQYAAIDSYCLLEIYRELSFVIVSQKLKVPSEISLLRKGDVPIEVPPDDPSLSAGDIRLLTHSLLIDLGAYLKQLKFDVEIEEEPMEMLNLLRKAKTENRTLVIPNIINIEKSAAIISVPLVGIVEQAEFVASRTNVHVDCIQNKPLLAIDPIQRVQLIAGLFQPFQVIFF